MIEEIEKVTRPWGSYRNIFVSDNYKVKIITVHPGQRLSLQKHMQRSEHWYIVSGFGEMQLQGKFYQMYTGDSIDIPEEHEHRIENTTKRPLIFVEVQMGICDESDIIRLEDDYGRVEPLADRGPHSGFYREYG